VDQDELGRTHPATLADLRFEPADSARTAHISEQFMTAATGRRYQAPLGSRARSCFLWPGNSASARPMMRSLNCMG
jgi:hypothetical protein